MNVYDYLDVLLRSGSIEDKLLAPPAQFSNLLTPVRSIFPDKPGRNSDISFKENQTPFPNKKKLRLDSERAKAIHFFANHELLAIEIMAATILHFYDEVVRRGILDEMLEVIYEEQKHLSLYLSRMNDLGVAFGDFAINDYFWRQFIKVDHLDSYFSLMSLTFEAANLDFALYYSNLFKEYGDIESSKILGIVLADEIKHVHLGAAQLIKVCGEDNLWKCYKESLPEFVTPARAKGIQYNEALRIKSGLPLTFVKEMKEYRDDFTVTNRK